MKATPTPEDMSISQNPLLDKIMQQIDAPKPEHSNRVRVTKWEKVDEPPISYVQSPTHATTLLDHADT